MENNSFVVQIQNYQILDSVNLKFEDGLTVIIGDSNNGKSSIIRAIEAAIFNKVGNAFIKSGTEATAVGIKANDHMVVWKKSADAGIYKVDGQVYNKIGRGQLAEVAKALNISEIDVNGEKVRINFLKQMEYPFLLDKNPTQLFEFLSMSNEGDKLAIVFQNMRSDLKGTNSNIDKLVGTIDSLNGIIARDSNILKNYDNIDSIVDSILNSDSRFQDYSNLVELKGSIEEKRNILIDKKLLIQTNREIKKKVEDLFVSIDDRMSGLQDLSATTQTLSSLGQTMSSTKVRIDDIRSKISVIDNVLSSIDIEDITRRQENIAQLKEIIGSIETQQSDLFTRKDRILDIRSQLEYVESQLNEFDTCPLCGSPLHKEV